MGDFWLARRLRDHRSFLIHRLVDLLSVTFSRFPILSGRFLCSPSVDLNCAQVAFVSPADLGPDEAGKMRADHYPGDIGFDPLGLEPEDSEEFDIMATKELQHGRLAMLAAAGFLAQEAVDGKGIFEHIGF